MGIGSSSQHTAIVAEQKAFQASTSGLLGAIRELDTTAIIDCIAGKADGGKFAPLKTGKIEHYQKVKLGDKCLVDENDCIDPIRLAIYRLNVFVKKASGGLFKPNPESIEKALQVVALLMLNVDLLYTDQRMVSPNLNRKTAREKAPPTVAYKSRQHLVDKINETTLLLNAVFGNKHPSIPQRIIHIFSKNLTPDLGENEDGEAITVVSFLVQKRKDNSELKAKLAAPTAKASKSRKDIASRREPSKLSKLPLTAVPDENGVQTFTPEQFVASIATARGTSASTPTLAHRTKSDSAAGVIDDAAGVNVSSPALNTSH